MKIRNARLKHVAFIGIHAPCFISLFERVYFAKTGAHFCATRSSQGKRKFRLAAFQLTR